MPQLYPSIRNRRSDELAQLADHHIQQDLQPDDREALKSAARKVSLWTTVGSAIGIGLGLYAAFRLRSSRKTFFQVFRAQEKPTKVVFADGRTGTYHVVTRWERIALIDGRINSGYYSSLEADDTRRLRDILFCLGRWTVSWWGARYVLDCHLLMYNTKTNCLQASWEAPRAVAVH
jgi:hypothetical protein